jgi:hypothetical protein
LYFVDKVIGLYGRKIPALRQILGKAGKFDHDSVISWCYISDVLTVLIRYQVFDTESSNNALSPPFRQVLRVYNVFVVHGN